MLWTSNNFHDLILFRYKKKKLKKKIFKYIKKIDNYSTLRKEKKLLSYKRRLLKKLDYKNAYLTIVKLRFKKKKKSYSLLGLKKQILKKKLKKFNSIKSCNNKLITKALIKNTYPKMYFNTSLQRYYPTNNSRIWVFINKARKNHKINKFKRKLSRKYIIRRRAKGIVRIKLWNKKATFFQSNSLTFLLKKKTKKKLIKKLKSKLIRRKFFSNVCSLYLNKSIKRNIRFISEPLITFSKDIQLSSKFWEKKILIKQGVWVEPKISKSFFKKKIVSKKNDSKVVKKRIYDKASYMLNLKSERKTLAYLERYGSVKFSLFSELLKYIVKRKKLIKTYLRRRKAINIHAIKHSYEAKKVLEAIKTNDSLQNILLLSKNLMTRVPLAVNKIKYIKNKNFPYLTGSKKKKKKNFKKLKFFLLKNIKIKYRRSAKKYFVSNLSAYNIKYLSNQDKIYKKRINLPKQINNKYLQIKNFYKKFKKGKYPRIKSIYYWNKGFSEIINSNKRLNIFNINNYLFLNKFSLENYTQKFYLFKKKVKTRSEQEGKTFFFNFRNKKLKTYRMARKTHWNFFSHKTIKADRYQKFLNIFLKKTKNYYFDVFNYFQFKFKFSYHFWSNFSLLYKTFYNLKISYKKVLQFPIHKDFWTFIVKYSFDKPKIERKIKNWQEKKIRIRKTFWMQQKKRIPKFFKKRLFTLPGQTNTMQYDFITNYFIILKKSLNPTHTNLFIFKNKFLKLHGFKYNS